MRPDTPNILLINPWIHDFAAYDFWAKPIGLLSLGALLRTQGFNTFYIDCLDRFHPKSPTANPKARHGRGPYRKTPIPKPAGLEDITRRYSRYGIDPVWFKNDLLALPKPDIILMTSLMTYWYPGVQEAILIIKETLPQTPIVLGGIYASLCHDHALSHCLADHVVQGPGEDEILNIIGSITGNKMKWKIEINNLDHHPYPAFDMQRKIPYVPLLTSSGCPYACAYCASRILNPIRRKRQPASVIEEIQFWHKAHKAEDFVFYDDALLVDAESHAMPIFESLVRKNIPVRFHTPNAVHIREIPPSTARLMYDAGFKTLRLGLESGDFEHRDLLDRKVTIHEFNRAVSCLKSVGFKKEEIGAYLLAGLPGQQIQSLVDSIHMVKESGITPVLAYYSPIPHTALWKKAVEASRYDLESDPIYTNNTIFPCQKEPFSWETLSRLKALTSM